MNPFNFKAIAEQVYGTDQVFFALSIIGALIFFLIVLMLKYRRS